MSIQNKKILIIVNPISGVKAKMEAVQLFESELSKEIANTIAYTEYEGHATELAVKAVKDEFDAVVAVGGDGTVNEVGRALIGTKVALGIIPFGSGNGFARHRKIPLQAKEAIHCINRFNIKTIDTATLNDEIFLTTSGLGFDAHVGQQFAKDGRRGFFTYSQIAISEFINYIPEEYQIIIDGVPLVTKAFVISIANGGQYGNNAWIAPDASMEDGKLNICIIKPFPAHITPDIIFKLFNKNLNASKYYQSFEAEEVRVIRANQYHIDGEPRTVNEEDLVIRIKPKSLRVIC